MDGHLNEVHVMNIIDALLTCQGDRYKFYMKIYCSSPNQFDLHTICIFFFKITGLVPESSSQVPQTGETIAKSFGSVGSSGLQWSSDDAEYLSDG